MLCLGTPHRVQVPRNSMVYLVRSRSLNGALNGNIGVIKCMVAEITDHTNIADAYAYLPISWATGQALGYAQLHPAFRTNWLLNTTLH